MKQKFSIFSVILGAMLISGTAMASDNTHSGHNMTRDSHMSGEKIRHATVDGARFEYRLIDMKKKMNGMPEMKETHHLMLYVTDMQGRTIETARVGYLIQGPDNAVEKKMAMAMNKGFGADISLAPGERYTVKTKVVAGDKTLMDSFEFSLSHQ